ncbi:C-type lectin domain family 10 member A-like [Ruditapes philippinarum]|uniref:C-type lectin domain family 10 member A-like n=1 Tax=Ruditapes philippinarum TaxID=129788 RepID=UPI00295B9BC6|nr:C-type lectin domain family 10 member A-like [Ruditapes philippinarum]
MINKIFFVILISLFCINEGTAKEVQKAKSIKKRLNDIEIRQNLQSNDILELQESIDELNQTYNKIDQCSEVDLNRDRRLKEKTNNREYENNNILFKAFKEEKAWIRAEIEEQKSTVNRIDLQFKALQDNFDISINKVIGRVDILDNNVELILDKNIKMINESISIISERLASEENRMKRQMAKIEKLGKAVDSIEKECKKFSVTLNDFESKTDDKIMKIREILATIPSCPSNWLQFSGNCYHLYKWEANIDSAVKVCSNENAFVADFQSEVELQYIRSIINLDQNIWVGITDREEEGNWKSLRNEKQIEFSNWEKGQPNNFFAGYDEGCAVMYHDSGLWHDYRCSHTFAYICKKVVPL